MHMNATPNGGGTSSATFYYVTFEDEQGVRRELSVNGHEYGLLAEGDIGLLSYRGDWYKGFARETGRVQ